MQFYTHMHQDDEGYWDIFYLMDLDTREILCRVDDDSKELNELKSRVEIYEKDHPNLEILRAVDYRLTKE